MVQLGAAVRIHNARVVELELGLVRLDGNGNRLQVDGCLECWFIVRLDLQGQRFRC